MRVGFLQFNPTFGDKKKNCRAVEDLLKDIVADIVVIPELFNTGYAFLNEKELIDLAEPAGGETYEFMHRLAQEKSIALAYGYAESTGNSIYNSMSFVAPDGIVAIYRKSHLFFEEKFLFTPGDTGLNTFEYAGTKLGMLICWDWIYPEAMRTLALKGAQVILHAANLVTPYCPDAMITRAIENRVFVITADRTGDEIRGEKRFHFIGKSQLVAPNGDIIARAGEETCSRVHQIDPARALDKKMNMHNDLFLDRRREIYDL
jgi:predicted amidohydrolase